MFGNNLKIARNKKGLSQMEVAERLNISRSVLSNYETNVSEPSLSILVSLAKLYEVSTDYLLDMKKEYHQNINSHLIGMESHIAAIREMFEKDRI